MQPPPVHVTVGSTPQPREPSLIDRVGEVLNGRYLLTRKIGEGSMAQVYEARHKGIGRNMAVKVLHRHLQTQRRSVSRFKREAQTLGKLRSENIVSVTDCGRADDGCPYLVMELLQGCDLRRLLLDHGKLSASQAVGLLVDACRGIQSAHSQGIIHRDLKPENLFVVRQPDGRETCKIVDFGVVKVSDESTLSHAGTLVGTVRYMAPEQALGSHTIDGRADVFALGAILSECLSGNHAFAGDTQSEVVENILHGRRRSFDPELQLPDRLCEILDRAMATDREARFASVHDFKAALARLLTASSEAPPSSRPLRNEAHPPIVLVQTPTEPEFDSLDEADNQQLPPPSTPPPLARGVFSTTVGRGKGPGRNRMRHRLIQLAWAVAAGLMGWLAGQACF